MNYYDNGVETIRVIKMRGTLLRVCFFVLWKGGKAMWKDLWPSLVDDIVLWDPDSEKVCAIFLFHCPYRGLHIVTEYIGPAGVDIPEKYLDPPHFGMHVGHAFDIDEARDIFSGQISYRRGAYLDHSDGGVHLHRRQWSDPQEWNKVGRVVFTIHLDGSLSPSVRIGK